MLGQDKSAELTWQDCTGGIEQEYTAGTGQDCSGGQDKSVLLEGKSVGLGQHKSVVLGQGKNALLT
jgi:hypothetical protein